MLVENLRYQNSALIYQGIIFSIPILELCHVSVRDAVARVNASTNPIMVELT